MQRVLLAIVLLSLTVLAGCAENSAPSDQDEETLVDQELQATSQTGVIRGVVVDPTITPVADATVKVRNNGLETLTAEDGSFGFSDLEPGAYFLDVSKAGFDGVQASVNVEAGVDRPPIVKIQIAQNASAAPFYQMTQWTGHLRCGVMAVVITFPCSVIRGTEDIVGDYNSEVMQFEVLPTFIQSELTWDNTQPLGESLFFNYAHCCNNAGFADNGTAQGPSPLTVNAHKAEMQSGDILEDGLEIRVFGGAYPGTEVVPGFWGVGVQIEQPVNSFTTQFFNFLPDEGWTFIADGAPVPPA